MKFKQIAHLYLGCKALIIFEDENGNFTDEFTGTVSWHYEEDDFYYLIDAEQRSDKIYDVDEYECSDFIIKPILRRLSSITEEEALKITENIPVYTSGNFIQALKSESKYLWNIHEYPKVFQYLLSAGFDIFGFIDKGEAIDAEEFYKQINNE